MLTRIGRFLAVTILAVAGLWLLLSINAPAPENVTRQTALQAMAPGTSSNADNSASLEQSSFAEPVVVDLREIPANVYDPDNQLDRYRRGEIDLVENDGLINATEKAALQLESQKLAPSRSVQQATSQEPGMLAPTKDVGFDSIDYTECCGGGGNVPPDPEMAAGPNHVIAAVNVAFEIYGLDGSTLSGPTTFSSFFNADPNCTGVFDPNALYDEEADRFILAIDADGDYYCMAVSETGDPTGNWFVYSFFASSDFFDYPHAGVGRDAIYMGSNIFFNAGGYKDALIFAFDKWAMYNNQPAAYVTRSLGGDDTPQPLNLHGYNQGTWPTSGPHYFITDRNFNGSTYAIWSWDDPFGANTLTNVGVVNLVNATGVSAGLPLDVPQQGGQTIQGNDYRPQDFEYRNGYGWTVQTIACNPGSGTVNCVRWAKIDPATASVVDAGVYASNSEYRVFGDLAVNTCDDMAVGYTKSSSSMYPSIYYTGRESGDPAGTLQAENELKAGEIAYTTFESSPPRRWGDYTGMTIGPDGETFWYLGEYSKNTGTTSGRWGTYIGSFTYPNCGTGVPPTPTPIPTATPTPDPNAVMHVGDLDGASTPANRNRWNATVTITIHDVSENPVANAIVDGAWSTGGTASCTTDVTGTCSVTKNNLKSNVANVTFSVTTVSHTSNAYDSGVNHDPDGDSNGTDIIVYKDAPPPPTPTPGPTATPGPSVAMHIGDLDGVSTAGNRNRWNAEVTITVHDSDDNPIANAAVSGSWSAGGTGNCTTDGAGQCSVTKNNLKNNVSSVTFSVTDIVLGSNSYDSGSNHDPDGDSNGTNITILQP